MIWWRLGKAVFCSGSLKAAWENILLEVRLPVDSDKRTNSGPNSRDKDKAPKNMTITVTSLSPSAENDEEMTEGDENNLEEEDTNSSGGVRREGNINDDSASSSSSSDG